VNDNQSTLFREQLELQQYPQSEEVKSRIVLILKRLGKQESSSATVKVKQKYTFHSLKNIVNEYLFSEDKSPLQLLLQKLFTQQRNLAKTESVVYKQDRSNLCAVEIIINVRNAKKGRQGAERAAAQTGRRQHQEHPPPAHARGTLHKYLYITSKKRSSRTT